MLTLMLLRHAKSSWDHPGLEDFDRPLGPRGLDAATQMGAFLSTAIAAPGLILCSSSVRTRQTLDLVLPRLTAKLECVFEDALYLACASELLARLRRVPRAKPRVMMIGHNPGIHDLALTLTASGDAHLRANLAAKFPTAALAVLTFKGDAWSKVGPGMGTLTHFIKPSQLLKGHATA